MSPSSTQVVASLRDLHLLDAGQLEQLDTQRCDAAQLVQQLVQRQALTAFQAHQLLTGGDLAVGQYVLVDRIGAGGMGTVFKAKHRGLGRLLALKTINPGQLEGSEAVQRFLRETRAAARLDHPHIIHAYDSGKVAGLHFLAMELVEGIDLGQRVKSRGALGIDDACDYMRQAALGLQHAHERGLVHRDIKPSNLFLTSAGMIKILDFGLVRLEKHEGEQAALTRSGAIYGSPDFVAPEQALEARSADVRADIYSLGSTLYFLLTAQKPFPVANLTQKLIQLQFNEPKPIEELRPETPPELVQLIKKLMSKKPEDRPESAAAVAQALDSIVRRWRGALTGAASLGSGNGSEGDRTTRLAPWTPRRLVAAVVILLGVLALWQLPRFFRSASAEKQPAQVRPRPLTRADQWQALAGSKGDPAQRSRAVLKFIQAHPGTGEALQAASLLRVLPAPFDALDPAALAPADRAAWQPAQLVAVLGKGADRHGAAIRGVAIDPGNESVATAGWDGAVKVWEIPAARPRLSLEAKLGAVYCAAFSPDGKALASAHGFPKNGGGQIWNLNSRQGEALACGGTGLHAVAWSPDGRWLACGGPNHSILLFDARSRQPAAELTGHTAGAMSLAFSNDSALLASGSWDSQILVWRMADQKLINTLAPGRPILSIAFSPDGRRLASGTWENGKTASVILWDTKTWSRRETLSDHPNEVSTIAYAPDGSVFASVGPAGTVFVRDAATNRPVFQWKLSETVYGAAFSADSRHLVLGHNSGAAFVYRLQTLAEATRLR